MACTGAIVGVSIYLSQLAVQRYDFFDMSSFMDAGWRMAWGQRPYTDFIYNAGPVHPAIWAIFFLIFGYGAKAILAYLFATNATVMVCAYLIVRSRLDWLLATICSVIAGVVLFSTTAHPWYDQTADAFSVVAMTVVLLSKVETRSQAIRVGLIAGALLACAFMSKANVALGAGAMIGLMLLGVPRRCVAWAEAGCFVGGILGLALILLLTRSDPMLFLDQTFFSYGESRFQELRKVGFVLYGPVYSFTVVCVLLAVVVATHARSPRRFLLIAAAGGLVATQIFGWATGSMVPKANYMLLGVALAPATLLLERRERRAVFRPTLAWAVLVPGVVLLFHAKQDQLLTWVWFPPNTHATYTFTSEPMRGWHTYPEVGAGVDAAVRQINANVPREESLWVMPTATMIYGLTGRESLRGQSFIYHIGIFPPPGAALESTIRNFHAAPPAWILIHQRNFNELAPAEACRPEPGPPHVPKPNLLRWMTLKETIDRDYEIVWSEGGFDLLKHRRRR